MIFRDVRDWMRFLFLIIYNQSNCVFYNLNRQISHYVKHRVFNINPILLEKIKRNRNIHLVSFAIMPNHFHLILKESSDNGISKYMQRIQNSYTKYFNTKYKMSGHLFQGPYQAVHVKTNNQILHLASYIHRNPRELGEWKNRESNYPWSSYQDYTKSNRWNSLLSNQILIKQFKNKNEYKKFVETSSAKELNESIAID